MKTVLFSCLLAAVWWPMTALAQSRTNQCETVLVFGTGMSAAGNPLREGSRDARFRGITPNFPDRPDTFVMSNVPASWYRGVGDSQWIAPDAGPSGSVAGTYVYQLTFAVPCAGATVSGRFAAADRAVILLNGNNTGIATSATGYSNWTTFSLSGLVAGTNTIDFVVTNTVPATVAKDLTGLRAELTATATCCPCIVLDCPTNIVVQTCEQSFPVAFNITGTNRCFTNLSITCTPPSGSSFAQGTHTVTCTARDTAGHQTNCSFTVQVDGYPPYIQQQPQGVLAMSEGGSHLLRVIAVDGGNCGGLTYQWRRNGVNVPGAISNLLLLNPLALSKSGAYSALVSNRFGVVTSEVAVVRVLQGRDANGVFQRFAGNGLWYFPPTPGARVFVEADVFNLRVQASSNLLDWVTLSGALSVDNGALKISDPFAALHPNRFYRMISGDSPIIPARLDPGATEVPVSSLSAQTLALAQQHIAGFIGASRDRGEDERAWENVTFAPIARYLHDPGYENGEKPAYVELKIIGSRGPLDPRGYLILSLTGEDFPVVEFATEGGITKTDRVLREAGRGTVHKFMRFSPAYIVGEDAAGQRLGAFGTEPLKVVDFLPSTSETHTASYDSETGVRVMPPKTPLSATPALNYEDLKADFQNNPGRLQFRALRKNQAASRWKLADGIRNPTLRLRVGATATFLAEQRLVSVSVESDGEAPILDTQLVAGGGFAATGLRAGSELVRVQNEVGLVEHYTVVVTSSTAPAALAKGACDDYLTVKWNAGTGWDGDQRQLRQLKRDRWCRNVGCGPVALAMLLGWWDTNGVPSAFYRLKSGKGNKDNFRFDFESLRGHDAPKDLSEDEDADYIVPLYDDLYGLCNVICNPSSDAAGTYPDQMASAFDEYTRRITDAQPSPEDEFGQKFVGINWSASWIAPGLGLTDWEGGGTMVANGIKAGRPGIVGIGSTLFDAHYPLAYVYKRIKHYEGCGEDREVVEVLRYFKCNMGWGSGAPPEWHNAEDVWFGLTANMWQKSNPVMPVDHTPADPQLAVNPKIDPRRPAAASDGTPGPVYFIELPNRTVPGAYDRVRSQNNGGTWTHGQNPGFGAGVFTSGPAVAVSSNGLKLHVFGRGLDDRIWRAYSPNGGTSWNTAWAKVGGDRVFKSAPAAAVSTDGSDVHVFALGTNDRFYYNVSFNGGASWNTLWRQPIQDGAFKSAPAVTISATGRRLYLIGLSDSGIWAGYSLSGGTNWSDWTRIMTGTDFTSAPALIGDASGQQLHVIVRRAGNRFWINSSSNAGGSWSGWNSIGGGLFSSGPGASISANGQKIHVFGRGLAAPPPAPGTFADPADPRIWRAYSSDGGENWAGWWEVQPLPEWAQE